MARRVNEISFVGHKPLLWPGIIALAVTPGVAGVAVLGLLRAAEGSSSGLVFDDHMLRVLRFTLLQACLSTLLSVVLAIPVARALARRPVFPGRNLLLKLFGLPLVLPVIVAVFGIIAVWGRHGLVSEGLQFVGAKGLGPIYGLGGILIAHVFFNLPLAIRMFLPVLESIQGEYWRLASQLGMRSRELFLHLELPRLMASLPAVSLLIFLLCFSSFTVVLALGGGPKASTLELAIYEALRLEFDVPRAVSLACLQIAICSVVGILFFRFSSPTPDAQTEGRMNDRPDAIPWTSQAVDIFWLVLASFWIALPILLILANGISGPLIAVLSRTDVWIALLRSLTVGAGAGFVAVGTAILLSVTTTDLNYRGNRRSAAWLEISGCQTLVISPVVIGAGLFILLWPWLPVMDLALGFAAVLNGLVAVPYVLRLISPPMLQLAQSHNRLCAELGIRGLNRIRLVSWPLLSRPIATAFALSSALATGDLTIIALFGTDREPTLPLLLYRSIGSYRMDESAVLALLLAVACLAVFICFERVGRAFTGN